MDDLRRQLTGLAEQATRQARPPGAVLTLRRARARRRWVAGATVTAALLVLGLVAVAPRLAGRETVTRPPQPAPPVTTVTAPPREVAPLWTAPAVRPEMALPPAEHGPWLAGDLVVVDAGLRQPGRVQAFDRRTGDLRWVYGTEGTALMRAASGREIVIAPEYGAIVALERASGNQRWRFPLAPGQSAESATIAGDSLYVGTSFPAEGALDPPIVYALDLATGRQRWRAVLDPGTDLEWGAPVAEAGLVLVADTPSHQGSAPTSRLHALDLASGRVRWTADLASPEQGFHTQRPLVADGRVFAVAPSGNLLAFDAGSGRELWRQRRGPTLPLLVGVSGGRVLAVMERNLVSLDAGTGGRRWALPVGAGETWAALADGTVHVVTDDGLVAVDASTGRERWRAPTGPAIGPPVGAGGRVYVATRSRLLALDAASGRIRWVGRREIATGPVTTPDAVLVTVPDGTLLGFTP
jgi:outer membrane protein assembly factor BamB